MPTDQTNPITGKDSRLTLLVAGIAQNSILITNFKSKPEFQKVEARPLGSNTVHVDHIPDGWSGSFEVEERNATMDNIVDAYIAAKRARIPTALTLVQTKYYKDGSSKTHTWLNVQIDFEASYERGANVKQTINWRSGDDRI